MLVPSLAVAIRRLHDTNKSGWFLLLALIPIVGFIVLIVFLATPGEPGPNNYGLPDPGPTGAQHRLTRPWLDAILVGAIRSRA